MSGTFPANKIQNYTYVNNQPNITSVALSGRRQAKSQGAQYSSMTIVTSPLSPTEHKEIMGFLAAQQGSLEGFAIVLPTISTPGGSVTGNVLNVNDANADAGDTSVAVNGGVASQTGYLKAGDMIRFITTTTAANNVKTYTVTADMDTNGSGEGTINFQPGLIDGVTNGSDVETNDVQFTVYMTGPAQEYTFGTAGNSQIEFEVREAF